MLHQVFLRIFCERKIIMQSKVIKNYISASTMQKVNFSGGRHRLWLRWANTCWNVCQTIWINWINKLCVCHSRSDPSAYVRYKKWNRNSILQKYRDTNLFSGHMEYHCVSYQNDSQRLWKLRHTGHNQYGLLSVLWVMGAWLPFQLSRIILYCAGFESYIRENFGFLALLNKIMCCLINTCQQ